MKPVYCAKNGNRLEPLSPVDSETLDGIPDGTFVEATLKPIDERKDKLLRHLFALGSSLMKHDPKQFDDVSDLIDACKLQLGLIRPGHRLDGKFFARPISTTKMNRQQIEQLHDGSIQILQKLYGQEVVAAIDQRPAEQPVAPDPVADRKDLEREMVDKLLSAATDETIDDDAATKIIQDARKHWLDQLPDRRELVDLATKAALAVRTKQRTIEQARAFLNPKLKGQS